MMKITVAHMERIPVLEELVEKIDGTLETKIRRLDTLRFEGIDLTPEKFKESYEPNENVVAWHFGSAMLEWNIREGTETTYSYEPWTYKAIGIREYGEYEKNSDGNIVFHPKGFKAVRKNGDCYPYFLALDDKAISFDTGEEIFNPLS